MFEHYLYAGTKRLRCGYSTGTCAALAARAATDMLLTQRALTNVSLKVPAGIVVEVEVHEASWGVTEACCAVRKDAGDDIDVTHGVLIYAKVALESKPGIRILGGQGVGVVTRPGLDQPVGQAAINSVPRAMIEAEVAEVCSRQGYKKGIAVTLSVPQGEEIAKKTFNAHLGIVGGISILGTSGLVKPHSVEALKDSIEIEVRQHAAMGERDLVITLGNYGSSFLKTIPGLEQVPMVSCANFVGFTLDCAARYHFERVLLVGHFGKLVKLAGGVMDTHSHTADCRREIICAHAAVAGATHEVARALLDASTTDACLDILEREAYFNDTLESLAASIQKHLQRRAAGAFEAGCMVFTNVRGELFRSTPAVEILRKWRLV